MRRPYARLVPILIGVGAFALPVAAQDPSAGCPTPTRDTGFQEVSVNVNAGTFSQVLPFDVPLRLCGSTAASSHMEVIYAVGCTPPRLDEKSCRALAARNDLASGPIELTRQQCRSQEVQYGRGGSATLDGTTFRSVLPRLEAERFYAFCFLSETKITPEQATAYAQQVRPLLDQTLAGVSSADFTSEQTSDLRQELIAQLQDLVGEGQILASGSLFDPTLPADQIRGDFNTRLRAVLQPQMGRRAQLASYANNQFQLRQALDQVRSSSALARFADELQKSAVGNVNLATLLANEYRAELALARMQDTEAAQAALGLWVPGQDPNEAVPSETLDQTSDPAVAAQIAEHYQELSQSLSNPDPKTLGLDELIQDALGQGLLAPYVKSLSAEERQQLEALAAGPVRLAAFAAFTLAGQAKSVQGNLEDRSQALDRLVDTVEIAAAQVGVANSSTVGNYMTAQNNYISADGGLLFAQEIDEVLPYIGTNIYFRPVNKNAPLASLGGFGRTFSRRFALTFGLTASSVSVKDQDGELLLRDNLFGNQNLVIGAGLRLSDMIRVGAGALVFKENDPSPLIDELEVKATYYLTVSFDLDVASTFRGGWGGLFN